MISSTSGLRALACAPGTALPSSRQKIAVPMGESRNTQQHVRATDCCLTRRKNDQVASTILCTVHFVWRYAQVLLELKGANAHSGTTQFWEDLESHVAYQLHFVDWMAKGVSLLPAQAGSSPATAEHAAVTWVCARWGWGRRGGGESWGCGATDAPTCVSRSRRNTTGGYIWRLRSPTAGAPAGAACCRRGGCCRAAAVRPSAFRRRPLISSPSPFGAVPFPAGRTCGHPAPVSASRLAWTTALCSRSPLVSAPPFLPTRPVFLTPPSPHTSLSTPPLVFVYFLLSSAHYG